jgi:hypothetical protein
MSTVTSIRTYRRPNTTIPFWFNQEFHDYVQTAYQDTGKILSLNIVLSEDELTQIRTIVWKDDLTLDQFNWDEVTFQYKTERDTYAEENNFTTDLEIVIA